jgi:phospholipid/cholesterol/gamma-HCH transport system substrate-binding protein
MMAAKLPKFASRTVVLGVVAALAVGLFFFVFSGSSSRKVSANFSSAVGVYPGTPVEILGIQVGTVTKITPSGDSVRLDMHYESKYRVPANAVAVVVANSLVSDRYIQLAPAYKGTGPTLADGANIPLNRTAAPAELDDIYGALNQLSVALGPTGANKPGTDGKGALSTLLDVSAANLKGNGSNLGQSITALSHAAQTLASGRTDLFATVKNLQVFNQALVSSDGAVRHFSTQLAQVSSDLANERADLGAALHNLSVALHAVATFVHDNAAKAHKDITGLEAITGVLNKDSASINESLAVGPIALANLVHAYQESTGTLGTRSNLSTVADPAQICGALKQLNLLSGTLLGPLTSQIVSTCNGVASSLPGGLPSIPGLNGGLLGGLPAFPGSS